MSSMLFNHTWNAEDYNIHSSVQYEAAIELLKRINIKGSAQILDIGCGDGKITAEISKKVPLGEVTGIDKSFEMISFCKKAFPNSFYNNLHFSQQDAQQFDYHCNFDIIFSSFCLQWVKDIDLFFKSTHQSLQPSGCIAATIPLSISRELEAATEAVISLPQWAPYFKEFTPGWEFKEAKHYKDLLTKNNFHLIYFSINEQKRVFHSRQDFEKYVLQWFSYLNPIPQDLKTHFFDLVMEHYLALTPSNEKGQVSFQFERLDLIAEKSMSDFKIRD